MRQQRSVAEKRIDCPTRHIVPGATVIIYAGLPLAIVIVGLIAVPVDVAVAGCGGVHPVIVVVWARYLPQTNPAMKCHAPSKWY